MYERKEEESKEEEEYDVGLVGGVERSESLESPKNHLIKQQFDRLTRSCRNENKNRKMIEDVKKKIIIK